MSDAVRKASEIAQAKEWSGDPRMNFLTAINAAKVLHKEVERLQAEINDILENRERDSTMARCEDFPCCGHELGCCPDFEGGVQVNMKCVCGATVPIDSPSSLCDHCLNSEDD